MFRSRGENLRTVYILLFLNIAFFFLEYQDVQKYAALFAFDGDALLAGDVWRLFSWQFTQAGQGWFSFPMPVVLFLTLLLLYLMGSALEEEWGSRQFLSLFAISTIASAAAAGWMGIPLLGSYFVNFTLLFVFASAFPGQTFYFFGVIPVRIRWIAAIAVIVLLAGVFAGGAANAAALAGAVAGYLYFLSQRVRRAEPVPEAEPAGQRDSVDTAAIRNAARFVAMRKAIAARSTADIDRLIAQSEREKVRGVNICPPPDFKPENSDGYCIRCEGFAECSARFLTMNRVPAVTPSDVAPLPEGTG